MEEVLLAPVSLTSEVFCVRFKNLTNCSSQNSEHMERLKEEMGYRMIFFQEDDALDCNTLSILERKELLSEELQASFLISPPPSLLHSMAGTVPALKTESPEG